MAIDETLDDFEECPLLILTKYTHPGVVAVVSHWSFFYNLYMSLRLPKIYILSCLMISAIISS